MRKLRLHAIVSLFCFAAWPSFAQEVSPERLGELHFRHIGPVGNRVASVAGVPGDPLTYYVGAASGGIWKSYNSQGQLLTVTTPPRAGITENRTTTYEESVYERLDAVRSRNRLGRWTHRVYDALRRVTATKDPLGRTVTQQWCKCGSLEALVDANGNRTEWERDVDQLTWISCRSASLPRGPRASRRRRG